MNETDIGFVEKCEPWRLESRFFPSKVGGRPAWLDLQDIPTSDHVRCDVCQNPCIFLCQIYAPYEQDPQAFHRSLYLFICRNDECCKPNDNKNLKILRSQLPRHNKYYPDTPPEEREEWRTDIRAETWVQTCRLCGILGSKHCAKCKKAYYCCRDHQIKDWKAGHKKQCNGEITQEKNHIGGHSNDSLFPELEIIIRPEDCSDSEDSEDELAKEKREMERFESLVKSGKAGTLQSEQDIDADLRNMSRAENDETFTNFTETVKHLPAQILRYNRGGTPLYISSYGRELIVPKCQACNGPRQFEFQIMPQLLNYLGFDDVLKSLDWGTLLIFTCQNSCPLKSGFAEEYVWKQDIVEAVSDPPESNK